MLLDPQHVSRPADLQVAHRQPVAAAQLLEILHRLEPLARRFGDLEIPRHQQVRKRLPVAAPDAAAQLVELREAEPVGAVDDDGVDVGKIEA